MSLVGLTIFSQQEWLYTVCRSVRIERIDKRGIRSVKCVLRSVNRMSLVGLRMFGLWFIERGIFQLQCASLGVRIVRIERTLSHCALM